MIKYPNGIKITNPNKMISKANQGMDFEKMLNDSNNYYLSRNIANIHKKPTPVTIVKVDYPMRSKAKIVEAYYQTPSTTDYNGIYNGFYIDFEAKETIKHTFYFSHIYEHQVKHLESISSLGGIAFVIIFFKSDNKIFIININEFKKLYYDEKKKSITVDDCEKIGMIVSTGYTPIVDYLKAVDILFKDIFTKN